MRKIVTFYLQWTHLQAFVLLTFLHKKGVPILKKVKHADINPIWNFAGFLWHLSKKRVLFDYLFTYPTFKHPHFVSRQKYLYMCNSGRLLFHPQCIWLVKLSLSKTFFCLKWPCRSLFLQCLINSIHRALALLTTYLCRMWFAIYIARQYPFTVCVYS